ncbi:MAG TPA: hypothetical protein VJT75_13840 [Thermoleophilaceae bacterium]|nr:hypothetical protein [Thermoleophilaceae bacterium]
MKSLLPVAALLSLAVAAPAHAATLRAAPQPRGNGQCSPAPNACTIQQAFANAGTGDEIVLAPGTYGSPAPYTSGLSMTMANVRIHGTHGFPRPKIEFNDLADTPVSITGAGDRLEYVDIHNRASMGLRLAGGSTASQVFVRADGSASTAYTCEITSGRLDNSVCWKPAESGAAAATVADCAGSASVVYRNVTLVGRGSGATGLTVRAFCGNTADARATNVIARGGEWGFHVGGGGTGASATLHADHSNYSSEFDTGAANASFFDDGGGNQAGQPVLFVNTSVGNFRERPNSPTVNKGISAAANGPRDLGDAPRARGASTDIGAFELQPPPTCTLRPKTNRATPQGKVQVVARCTQAASVTVRGTVKRKRKNTSPKVYALKPVTVSVAANVAKVVALELPPEALSKLRDGASESATFTLRATNANGAGTASTSIDKIAID